MSLNTINATHDPALRSWVSSANAPASDFPIQNLPFCAFRRARSAEGFRGGVAIGDQVLDLGALQGLGLFDGLAAQALAACAQPVLNTFMGLGAPAHAALRAALSAALRTDSALAQQVRPRLIPQDAVEYRVAAQVGDYTDFYASIHHATAVGRLFRPDNPLLQNYKWVTLAALAPFRVPWSRPAGESAPLAYLDDGALREAGAIDIQLEAWLDTSRMRAAGLAPQRLSQARFRDSWWTVAQMLAHHTVNGCNLNAGDLLGSGTQSGPLPSEGGSLLELTGGGRQPIALAGGETRTFLEDGDRVGLRGWCERGGYARIGFGEAVGTVLPG